MPSRLTRLQERVITALSGVDPPWTLTGGAALAGVYLAHRTTRDLDLFWHDLDSLGHLGREVEEALRRDGLEVSILQSGSTFRRLRVAAGEEVILVDLVADAVATIEAPVSVDLGYARIHVDTAHEILVNKLCALVSRSELRDLVDLRALLGAGGDLERALADAPRKDGGFSALTLAWSLKQLSLASSGLEAQLLEGLEAFRDDFLDQVTRGSAPD